MSHMRKLFAIGLMLLFSLKGGAQDLLTLKDVFRQMPDSIVPYLSENNRLDFIDFMESGMKAEVKNRLGGTSEMTALTDDSLSIRMSEALRMDILLLKPVGMPDSCRQVVCVVNTFGTDSLSLESQKAFYTPSWGRITQKPSFSAVDSQRIKRLEVQTILKRDDKILKKN